LNLAERRPNRLKEFLLYSHPSIDHRIEQARRFPPHPTLSPTGGEDQGEGVRRLTQ
ncbi:MAG: hypothetical protein XU13_C0093G0001, partial [Candidatus Rokubacteria bacterium CSP1-6]